MQENNNVFHHVGENIIISTMEELRFVLRGFQALYEYPQTTLDSVLATFEENGITCIGDYANLEYPQRSVVSSKLLFMLCCIHSSRFGCQC